jgi:hypothetical protein
MQAPVVKKREVVFICGYEIAPPEVHHRRFERELPNLEKTWNVKAKLSPPEVDKERHEGRWRIDTEGPNWRVDTDYRIYWWGDLISPDFEQPNWRRLLAGLAAFFDFVFSGALLAYFRMNWRYALFFLYPYVFLAGTGIAAWYLVQYLLTGLVPFAGMIAVLAGFAAAFALLYLPPRPLYLGYLFNDWHFAHELVRQKRTALEARLDQFARNLVELARASTADEIVLVGHSLGAVQVIDVVARAKRLDPQFATKGAPVRILTVGSSLLKIGLHPAARALREAVREVANDPNIFWIEFQAISDIVNFYKSNPVTDMGLPPAPSPVVQIVRVKHMLARDTYKGLKRDFFRVHRQFVMSNEQRYYYDYYMICCGPVPLHLRAANEKGSVAAFAADGSFDPSAIDPAKPIKSVASKKSKAS